MTGDERNSSCSKFKEEEVEKNYTNKNINEWKEEREAAKLISFQK